MATQDSNPKRAFPVTNDSGRYDYGMTLHDWYVGQALVGFSSCNAFFTTKHLFQIADDIMEERARRADAAKIAAAKPISSTKA